MQKEWEEADGWVEGTCDQCGKAGKVVFTNDPFDEEIYEKITESEWWCYKCHNDRYLET